MFMNKREEAAWECASRLETRNASQSSSTYSAPLSHPVITSHMRTQKHFFFCNINDTLTLNALYTAPLNTDHAPINSSRFLRVVELMTGEVTRPCQGDLPHAYY